MGALRRRQADRATKNRSRTTAFARFFSATFLRHFLAAHAAPIERRSPKSRKKKLVRYAAIRALRIF
jgi:hypothetical protein